MKSPLLTRLDEIEELDCELGIDAEALDIMETFAVGYEELKVLVARYAGSRSVNVAGYLAFLLAKKAENPMIELYGLLFTFIEKSRYKYEPRTLQSCLKVLWLLQIHNCIWQPREHPPSLLYPFLQRCLDYSYSGRDAVLVQRSALQVISILYENGLLEQILNPMQLAWVRERLRNLSARKLDLLDGELADLAEFSEKEHLFIQSPVLKRLDQILLLTIEDIGEVNGEVFTLMETFAQGIDELWILVERYGDSPSRSFTITLTSLAARMSEVPNLNTTYIVFSLIEKIRSKGEPIAFVNCLTSLRQQVLYAHTWQTDTQPPVILYPFLQYCLTYPNALTQYEAIRVLTTLCARDLLKRSATPKQFSILHKSAVQAVTFIKSELGDSLGHMISDLSILARCLGTI